MMRTASIFLLLNSLAYTANAFPNGAGSCAEGDDKFPKDSQHERAGEGDISDSGYLSVMIGTVNLDEGIVREEGAVQYTPVGICTGEGFLCQMCQGDCDNNEECEGDLICWQRDADEPVPGCFGMAVTERDYCTRDPNAPPPTPAPTSAPTLEDTPAPTPDEVDIEETPAPTPDDEDPDERPGFDDMDAPTPTPSPEPVDPDTPPPEDVEYELGDDCEDVDGGCTMCQGDCDDDDDCAGALECFQREDDEPVPGCTGDADDRADYCYAPNSNLPPEPVDLDTPPPEDVEFESDLDCEDVDGGCTMCQGDCDNDDDCVGALECFQREDDEPVPGCTGDADDRVDYCYAPNSNRRDLQADSPLLIQAEREYTITIMSDMSGMNSDAMPFKGFLIRLSGDEGQDLSGSLSVDDDDANAQELLSDGEGALGIPMVSAAVCPETVAGVTHTNNADKTSVSVYLEVDADEIVGSGEVSLEVTVMVNKDEYYMTTYALNIVDTTGDYTPPILQPTAAPVLPPTMAPVEEPVEEPTVDIGEPTVPTEPTEPTEPAEPTDPAPSPPSETPPTEPPSGAQRIIVSAAVAAIATGIFFVLV